MLAHASVGTGAGQAGRDWNTPAGMSWHAMTLTISRVRRSVCRAVGMFADFRRHQFRAPRLVAAVVAVAWFGFAAAPCQACPDAGQPKSSHHGSMSADHCGHGPDTNSTPDEPCAVVAAADCPSQGLTIVERREGGDTQMQAAPPPAFIDLDPVASDIGLPADARIRQAPVARASVQQRYCTYLK